MERLNNSCNDKEFLKKDNPGLVPDPAISERLNYYFLLKNPQRKVHSNSFAGLFIWLISFKNLALKTGIAAVFVFCLLFKNQFTSNPISIGGDTCLNYIQLVDTNFIYKDTCKY